jgi:hypothetical protein
VVNVTLEEKKARYRVTSNVFLKMISTNPSYGDLEIAGNLSRSVIIFLLKYVFRKKTLTTWIQSQGMTSILQTLEG